MKITKASTAFPATCQLPASRKPRQQQLQKYETGANRLSVGMAAQAADMLGVPIEQLFQKASAPDESDLDDQARLLEQLCQEGSYYLQKASSKEALVQMVQVLKVLSSNA